MESNKTDPVRPTPAIFDWNREYFSEDAVYRTQTCEDCGQAVRYPRIICPFCWSSNLVYKTIDTTARLYSWTVVHRPKVEYFELRAPVLIGAAQFSDGDVIVAGIVNYDGRPLEMDMPVQIVMEKVDGAIALPQIELLTE